jgi:S-adenosylmethionine:tRNA ribosyltransferase-isomerase
LDLFALSSYDYDLPEELIAQVPITPRDHSRLMIVERQSGLIKIARFDQLSTLLNSGDALIFNDTQVIPARLFGTKSTGGRLEFLLLKHLSDDSWEALVRPAKKVEVGTKVTFGQSFGGHIEQKLSEGKVVIRFEYTGSFQSHLQEHGQIPLPHYIRREKLESWDKDRYQTVYAATPGAVAAPTAGLHFTNELLQTLRQKGVEQTHLTLHVGVGTFRPVLCEDIRNHPMHSERVILSKETAKRLNQKGALRIAVGTTTCRALESTADELGVIHPGDFETDIFIYPGYRFKYVDAMITNFHLPKSSLLMLVSAFAGYELMREAYRVAVKEKFRFFSYGDAMLIL